MTILLLDFDNTLVQTLPLYRKAHNQLLNQNISQVTWDRITAGLNVHQIADVLDNHFGIGDKQLYIENARNKARENIMKRPPNDDIIRLINNFKGEIFILSGNDTNLICNYIKKWNLPIKLTNVIGECSVADKKTHINYFQSKGHDVIMVDDNKPFIDEIKYKCKAICYTNRGVLRQINRLLKY